MSPHRVHKSLIVAACLSLVVLLVAGLSIYINAINSDIGRHIKNGELIVHGASEVRSAVLHTNFYSYTHPQFPFINHHWLGGVILYGVFSLFGFVGLSLFNIFLIVLSVAIVVWTVSTRTGLIPAALATLILSPIIMYRTEVRPETFTVFFVAVYISLFHLAREKKIGVHWLYIIPILQILWVNIHIGFIFGIAIAGIFFFDALIKKTHIQHVGSVVGLSVIASCINPSGISGALYPFRIFSNYGYQIVENQSISRLKELGVFFPAASYFEVIFFLLLVWIFVHVVVRRKFKHVLNPFVLIAVMFSILAFTAIRNLSLAGIFSIPMLAVFIAYYVRKIDQSVSFQYACSLILIAVSLGGAYYLTTSPSRFSGIGLMPGNEQALTFIREHSIKGPIYNNYDIGGYLIYGLAGKQKVFVDNRPEAYPARFFRDDYINPSSSVDEWKRLSAERNFNVIVWGHRDITQASRLFLEARAADTQWAPVYLDEQVVIFLRRNAQNTDLISRFELPQERFVR